jgi:hemerythrin
VARVARVARACRRGSQRLTCVNAIDRRRGIVCAIAPTGAGMEHAMALFEWGPKFELGIAQVDAEHRRVVELINTLHDAMAQGRSKEVLSGVLSDLVDYTQVHFRNEEALYRAAGFPATVGHAEIHAGFADRARTLKAGLDAGTTFITMETMQSLKGWLADHILKSDRAGCDFLKSRGVS